MTTAAEHSVTRRSVSASVASIPSPLYAAPPNLARPLRVTLVTPKRIPVWLSRFLQVAAGSSWLAVSVLPVTGATLPAAPRPALDQRLFLAFDRGRRKGANATVRPVPLRARDCLVLAPAIKAGAAAAELKSRVEELEPNLVLSLGPRAWSETLADCAPLGCWDIDASLVDAEYAGLGLLSSLVKGDPVTRLALELEGATLSPWGHACSYGATRFGSFGVQRDTAFRKLPLLLLRMLHRLAADEFVPPNHRGLLRQSAEAALGIDASPRALAITLGQAVQWQFQKGRRPIPWHLVVRETQAKTPIDPAAPQVHPDAVVKSVQASYWADPCAVEVDGRKLVFVEEMWPDHKGIIVCVELHDGAARRLGVALEESAHLSYPQVFESNGEWYMTAESSQLKRVSLYKASRFPMEWERVCDLVTGRVCADPTLYFHEGRWYLFGTVSENGNGTWDELFLFVSDELTGPFKPHPANPIVSDVRRARPAGRLFVRNGKLIRPAQDCAANYGSALVFNEVLALSPTHYDERPLSRLAPDWADRLVACHTYSASDSFEVLDARGYPDPATPVLPVTDLAPRLEPADAANARGHAPTDEPADTIVPRPLPPAAAHGGLPGLPPSPDARLR
jgi:hypothetical protein